MFVEKPLALSESELQEVLDTIAETGNDRLMVGFNRRFSPMLKDMRSRFGVVAGSGVVRYAVNAGQLGAAAGTTTRSSRAPASRERVGTSSTR